MKKRLFTGLGAITWISALAMLRQTRRAGREAERQLRLAVIRNDEAIKRQRDARAMLEEHHVA